MTHRLNPTDRNYTNLLRDIVCNGDDVPNRTGIGTRSVLGRQLHYDLSKGFPIVSIKKTAWKKAVAETLWFLSGDCTNISGLVQTDRDGNTVDATNIWKPWQKNENGYLGPIYGFQWRHWASHSGKTYAPDAEIDQIHNAIKRLKSHPDCRRNIVTAWNPDDIPDMALPPCHVLFQFTARNGKLHLHMYQRSCDVPIGVPFNMIGYGTILLVVAKLVGLDPGTFIHTLHDAHIYENQMDGVQTILERASDVVGLPHPQLVIHGEHKSIADFQLSDFELVGYEPLPAIKFPVAV